MNTKAGPRRSIPEVPPLADVVVLDLTQIDDEAFDALAAARAFGNPAD